MNAFVISLNSVFDEYFKIVEFVSSAHSLKVNKANFNKHIKDNLGLSPINKITFFEIQTFCNELLKKEYKEKTVYNILSLLKVVFKYAMKRDYIKKSPCDGVLLPRYDNRRYFSFSVELQEKYIKAIRDNKRNIISRDIFFFLLHGRRFSEVVKLRFENIDFQNKIYFIPYQINKARRDMVYKMTDELYKRLLKYYKKAQKAQKNKNPMGYIFLNPKTNAPFKDLRRSWHKLLKENNLPYIRIHDIRHLIGTYSINTLKIPIESVQITLGHTDIKTTQRYITANSETSKKVIDDFLKIK